jgi:hypothetical protein
MDFAWNLTSPAHGFSYIPTDADQTLIQLHDNSSDIVEADISSVSITVASPLPPVPEPSTWAMMLVGFAGFGVLAYRRGRVSASHAVKARKRPDIIRASAARPYDCAGSATLFAGRHREKDARSCITDFLREAIMNKLIFAALPIVLLGSPALSATYNVDGWAPPGWRKMSSSAKTRPTRPTALRRAQLLSRTPRISTAGPPPFS